jgi:hypothetical protein
MTGFLREDVRDYVALAGLALALLQTWLAVKAVRKARNGTESSDPVKKTANSPRPVLTGEDVSFEHDMGSCLFVVAGIVAVVGAATVYATVLGYSAFLMRYMESVSSIFTTVLSFAVFIGGLMIVQWSRATGSRPVLKMSLVYGIWIAITLSAAFAWWWCFDKDVNNPLVRAAAGSSLTILIPVVGATVHLCIYGLWRRFRRNLDPTT